MVKSCSQKARNSTGYNATFLRANKLNQQSSTGKTHDNAKQQRFDLIFKHLYLLWL